MLVFFKKKMIGDDNELKKEILKGGIAIADQIIFSGSNFFLNIYMARLLGIDEYGAFSLAYTLFLFLSGFHNALLLEPISVFATSKYNDRIKTYFSNQIIIHFVITFLISLCLTIIILIIPVFYTGSHNLFNALLGMSVFLPFLLLIWLARRIFYILQRPGDALFASFIYSGLLGGGAVLISGSDLRNNLFLWYALIGVASLLSSLKLLSMGKEVVCRFDQVDFKTLFIEQWNFGRWIILATCFYSIGTQIQIFLTAYYLGLEGAGTFRVIQIFMLPMTQIMTAISSLSLPAIAFEFGRRQFDAMKRKSLRIAGIMIFLAILYELLLFWGSNWINEILFLGKYSEISKLFPLIGIVPLISSFETVFSLILRSLQKPYYYLIDKSIAAIIGGLSAAIFIFYWNVMGAVLSLILVELAALVTYWILYKKWFVTIAKTDLIKGL